MSKPLATKVRTPLSENALWVCLTQVDGHVYSVPPEKAMDFHAG